MKKSSFSFALLAGVTFAVSAAGGGIYGTINKKWGRYVEDGVRQCVVEIVGQSHKSHKEMRCKEGENMTPIKTPAKDLEVGEHVCRKRHFVRYFGSQKPPEYRACTPTPASG